LIIHITPGIMEMDGWKWFTEDYNRKFVHLLRTYADIILAVHAGHQHLDSFRLVKGFDGVSTTGIFLAPSITPSRAPRRDGSLGPAHNPAMRRIYYNTTSPYTVVDIEQFYLPLTETNRVITDPASTNLTQPWKLLYTYRRSYDIPDVSGRSLSKVLSTFKTSDSAAQFHAYHLYNTVGSTHHSNVPCDCACKYAHLCAIEHIDYGASDACIAQAPCKARRAIIGYFLVCYLLALVEFVLYCKY